MASCDIKLAIENLNKFSTNTRKIIMLTNDICKDLSRKPGEIGKKYKNIPGLLDIALLVFDEFKNEKYEEILVDFLQKSIPVWDKIKNRDGSILSENLSLIIPDNEYIPIIQYAYGDNPDGKIHVDDKKIKNMWLLITALIHNSIKYSYYGQNKNLHNLINRYDAVAYWNVKV